MPRPTPEEMPLPSETQSADFYKMASRTLSNAVYNHYEISSYCKEGFSCKHNLSYWKNKPFYGFGLGSASYVGGLRFSRPAKMREYLGYLHNLKNGVVDCRGNDCVKAKDTAMDVVMLSLRTARGLDLKSFGEAFGDSLVFALLNVYKPYVESRRVVCLDENSIAISADEFEVALLNKDTIKRRMAYVRLSDPDGFLLSNELISLAFGVIAP